MDLAPEIVKMRDALLDRISGKSLKEVSEIVNEILLNETNNINRLAALSARVQVLREFTKKEYNKEYSSNFNRNKIQKNNIETDAISKDKSSIKNSEVDSDEWVRVKMLKTGIVNGVRFPEGVVIDVSKSDAKILEEQKLAKIVEVSNNDEQLEKNKSDKSIAESKTKEEKGNIKSEVTKEEALPTDVTSTTSTAEVEAKDPEPEAAENSGDQETAPTSGVEAKDPESEAAENSGDQKTAPTSGVEAKDPEPEAAENSGDQETAPTSGVEAKDPEPEAAENKKEVDVEKKILKKKSTKITEETIELTDPKAVAEALGLNDKKKKDEEPVEIEEEVDIESLEMGKTKK